MNYPCQTCKNANFSRKVFLHCRYYNIPMESGYAVKCHARDCPAFNKPVPAVPLRRRIQRLLLDVVMMPVALVLIAIIFVPTALIAWYFQALDRHKLREPCL